MSGVRRTIAYLGRLNGGAYDGILGVLLSTRGGCDGSVTDLRWPPMIRSRTFAGLPRSGLGPSKTSHDPVSVLRRPPTIRSRYFENLPRSALGTSKTSQDTTGSPLKCRCLRRLPGALNRRSYFSRPIFIPGTQAPQIDDRHDQSVESVFPSIGCGRIQGRRLWLTDSGNSIFMPSGLRRTVLIF